MAVTSVLVDGQVFNITHTVKLRALRTLLNRYFDSNKARQVARLFEVWCSHYRDGSIKLSSAENIKHLPGARDLQRISGVDDVQFFYPYMVCGRPGLPMDFRGQYCAPWEVSIDFLRNNARAQANGMFTDVAATVAELQLKDAADGIAHKLLPGVYWSNDVSLGDLLEALAELLLVHCIRNPNGNHAVLFDLLEHTIPVFHHHVDEGGSVTMTLLAD